MNATFAMLGVSPSAVVGLLVAVAVFATVVTFALPMLQGNELKTRMKVVATERDEVRQRERARLASDKDRGRRGSARQLDDSGLAFKVVNRFNLKEALADAKTVSRLRQAGYRGQRPLTLFLFARFSLPFVLFVASLAYVFGLGLLETRPFGIRILACVIAAYVGFYLPNLLLSNKLKKRQLSIGRAWPDALDLLLICVESGLASEAAFRRVSEEIGIQSVALAEELVLLCAELSYLADRRVAYENLHARIGLETVRSAMTALIQAERYGTPLGQALRVLAQESRDHRMNLAEKKAASLPPKLTVPMIVFFLPVLFAVIMGPAVIQIMATFG